MGREGDGRRKLRVSQEKDREGLMGQAQGGSWETEDRERPMGGK